MLVLRAATPSDQPALVPRMRAFNQHDGIAVDDAVVEVALAKLLAEPALGGAWLIERDGAAIGYAVVTYGYDLEFGGRDAYLTELWIDVDERGGGAGTAVLALLDPELRARGVLALHLMVRPENPALRLYARSGFVTSPRLFMTRAMR